VLHRPAMRTSGGACDLNSAQSSPGSALDQPLDCNCGSPDCDQYSPTASGCTVAPFLLLRAIPAAREAVTLAPPDSQNLREFNTRPLHKHVSASTSSSRLGNSLSAPISTFNSASSLM
jgi:hypothetical protein